MQIRALKDGVRLEFPDGGAMLVNKMPTDVPKEYEGDVRRALAAQVHGIQEASSERKTKEMKTDKEA
jgi:hypothetical protein